MSTASTLIAALRAETQENAISPDSLGYILERMLAEAGAAEGGGGSPQEQLPGEVPAYILELLHTLQVGQSSLRVNVDQNISIINDLDNRLSAEQSAHSAQASQLNALQTEVDALAQSIEQGAGQGGSDIAPFAVADEAGHNICDTHNAMQAVIDAMAARLFAISLTATRRSGYAVCYTDETELPPQSVTLTVRDAEGALLTRDQLMSLRCYADAACTVPVAGTYAEVAGTTAVFTPEEMPTASVTVYFKAVYDTHGVAMEATASLAVTFSSRPFCIGTIGSEYAGGNIADLNAASVAASGLMDAANRVHTALKPATTGVVTTSNSNTLAILSPYPLSQILTERDEVAYSASAADDDNAFAYKTFVMANLVNIACDVYLYVKKGRAAAQCNYKLRYQ